LLHSLYGHHYPQREDETNEEAEKPGVRVKHCRGMIQHARNWMQNWIDEHPELLQGKLGEESFEVMCDVGKTPWGNVLDDDEIDEEAIELVTTERWMQSAEAWAAAAASDDLLDVCEAEWSQWS
jgi:hypothetical protein